MKKAAAIRKRTVKPIICESLAAALEMLDELPAGISIASSSGGLAISISKRKMRSPGPMSGPDLKPILEP